MFKLCPLGISSAVPAHGRHMSAQLLIHESLSILLDCGEGTQFQIQKHNLKINKLNVILISHLHGDHILGLPGLLNSLSMNDRNQDIFLIAPPQIIEWLNLYFSISSSYFSFNLNFIPLKENLVPELVFENESLTIHSFLLKHSITTFGFKIVEKDKKRKLLQEKAEMDGIGFEFYSQIKEEIPFQINEKKINPEDYLGERKKSASYAYCTDTLYLPEICSFIKNVDLLYHESTYLIAEQEKATNVFHSTASQAAQIAQLASCKKLLLGHFSARYNDSNEFVKEASLIFPDVEAAIEGKFYSII